MKVAETVQRHFARLALRRPNNDKRPRGSQRQLLPSKTGTDLGNEDDAPAEIEDKLEDTVAPNLKDNSDRGDSSAIAVEEKDIHGDGDGVDVDNVGRQRSSGYSERCEKCRRREVEERVPVEQNNALPAPPNDDTGTISHPTWEKEVKVDTCIPAQTHESSFSRHVPASGETLEVRNASNQTAYSGSSSTTVHHDPSKRASTFADGVESRFHELDISPFADRNAVSRLSGLSSSPEKPSASTGPSRHNGTAIHEPGISDEQSMANRHPQFSSESSGLQMFSRRSSRSASAVSRRILSSSEPERRDRKRSRALLGFNISAEILGLDPLTCLEEAPKPDTRAPPARGSDESGSGDSLFHRLRNAGSNLTMKRKKSVRRGLRRMKTMTNMKVEYPIGSLKGKGLEEVARLGGESILDFSKAYSPAPLCLPTCIAAPALYLQDHGPTEQYLYVKPGKQAVVCSLYSHYAKHVLGAMRARYSISKTTRPIEFPRDILDLEGSPKNRNESLYDVATFLRLRLSELPGGILGNAYLFRVLKQIHDHNFAPELVFQDPGRKEYVWESPPSTGTRVRMIALALVALTTDMQFELICAVFGLLAMTLDESQLKEIFHFERLHVGEPPCDQCRGYPKINELVSAFAPLLYDTNGVCDADILREPVRVGNGHEYDVMTMMISLWRLVVTQLRQWEVISTGR